MTVWDDRGFPMTRTVPSGWQTMPKSFDDRGFLITGSQTAANAAGFTSGACLGVNCGPAGKVVGTSTSKAEGARQTPILRGAAAFGIAAAFLERLLL
jgi:hypothetical protein